MKVKCPTCKKDVLWVEASKFRPFCCKRCQLIDLGEWANEAHAIKGEPTEIVASKSIYFD
ncbi:zinc-binding protein [Psychromonas sp. PRT-SC03]|nr:zinc-binding protein [Psychromonas sp. PRT-SC03]